MISIPELNRIKQGQTRDVKLPKKDNVNLRVRRIPGGFIYEYYQSEELDIVTAAVFVSTDDLINT